MASSRTQISPSKTSTNQKVVELLNDAQTNPNDNERIESLKIVQETVLHKDPDLLDNFLDEIVAFQTSHSQEVRKFVVGFIEETCKKYTEFLPKVITNLQMLLNDRSVVVKKRVIQAMAQLYKMTLKWLCTATNISEGMDAGWTNMVNLKDVIIQLVDSDNDGVRTVAIKFMEMVVLTQTHRGPSSAPKENDFCLDDVPLSLKLARPRKLEEDARKVFDELVKYHGSAHISSANLMTCMGALTNIAKLRPEFLSKVITTLEMLQANLPPTLAKSQVSSVRKHLKNQLLSLLRHPAAAEHHFTNITTLLTDLGASREEVNKALPQYEEMKKLAKRKEREALKSAAARAEEQSWGSSQPKRQEIDFADDEDDEDDTETAPEQINKVESAVDITEKFVYEQLKNPSFAAELVMMSMGGLPKEIPPLFNNTYTPIAAAGTETQVKHVSRLLAAQLTNAGLGPGIQEEKRRRRMVIEGGDQALPSMEDFEKKQVKLAPSGISRPSRKTQALKLSEVTKPLSSATKKVMVLDAVQRILRCDRASNIEGVKDVRIKIITSLAASYPKEVKTLLIDYILEDVNSRIDLAFGWLYEEYCFYQGFNRNSSVFNRPPGDDSKYNDILCSLLNGVNKRTGDVSKVDRDATLRRLYLESPIITSDAIGLLKQFCMEQGRALQGVSLMKDLVLKRPVKQLNFLNSILEFCSHEDKEVRDVALGTVISLYDRGELASIIEEYSVMFLKFLPLARPPDMLFGADKGRPEAVSTWNEDIIKVCLNLYLALLPKCQKLLTNLADVYVSSSGDTKRVILRIIEDPIREIGMESTQLLALVENCPKGSETLITRIIHILTERTIPSKELVDKVRELYAHRVADVRFLIPVLSGLSRPEVIAALPKLIKLNPGVVKEVFNRLLGLSTNGMTGAMLPSDLLIALHNIDPTKCDMKTVMKATGICFSDRSTYTMEVLTIVLQQLMEQKDIPLLMMRTVIQSVSIYPGLVGFIMNILQRLIVKQVWKQKTLWDGFIKCCQRLKPQSFTVLLQLPPPQLDNLLKAAEDLRDPLLIHVQNFTDAQRQHLSAETMDVLYDKYTTSLQDPKDKENKETNSEGS